MLIVIDATPSAVAGPVLEIVEAGPAGPAINVMFEDEDVLGSFT
jgi:hypothetical protein